MEFWCAGLVFTEAGSYGAVYDGLWGFNGILSAAAIGGFFFAFTLHSFASALANVIFTVLIQHALAIAFGPVSKIRIRISFMWIFHNYAKKLTQKSIP